MFWFTIEMVIIMYCKKCGAALPSQGFVCKSCGTMMDSEQIKEQKDYIKDDDNKKLEINLLSDKYSSNPIKRDYSKRKDNKILGAILIILILIALIIIALLKVM